MRIGFFDAIFARGLPVCRISILRSEGMNCIIMLILSVREIWKYATWFYSERIKIQSVCLISIPDNDMFLCFDARVGKYTLHVTKC